MFEDREQAGRLLAEKVNNLGLKNLVILGLARGGVIVAWQIAKILNAPIQVLVVRKIGAPYNPELAVGAVGAYGKPYLDKELISQLEVSKKYLNSQIKKQMKEAKIKELLYQKNKKVVKVRNKNVVLVDDGIATGSTMIAAIQAVLRLKPNSITLALPVAPPSALSKLESLVDRIIVLIAKENFRAVGQYFRKFGQVEDEEVIKLLA